MLVATTNQRRPLLMHGDIWKFQAKLPRLHRYQPSEFPPLLSC